MLIYFQQNKLLTTAICIALFICCFFYLLSTHAGNGVIMLNEIDTRIFLQYAQNMADGLPYVFSIGDSPSTGSTSHLYPLLLSIPAKLGFRGSSLITIAYLLNAACYLISLKLVWDITRKLSPNAAPLALVLTTLSGQTVNAFLGMTDMGLYTVLILFLIHALLYENRRNAYLFLTFCCFTRPEGFILSIAFLCCVLVYLIVDKLNSERIHKDPQQKLFIQLALVGLLAFGCTLLINKLYTGQFQFMSVTNKGYFKAYPFWGAIENILKDILLILKGLFWGLPDNNRQFYMLPLLGGFFGISGILLNTRTCRSVNKIEVWMAFVAAASITIVATGQFQGISNDRYLSAIFILWMIYCAIGICEWSNRLASQRFLWVSSSIMIGFQWVSLIYVAGVFYERSVSDFRERQFADEIKATIPTDKSFGCGTGGSLAYLLPNHKVYNIYGILSPDFHQAGIQQQAYFIVDKIKHNPHLRFDYWYNAISFQADNPWAQPFIGKRIMINNDMAIFGPFSQGIFETDWSTLDGGHLPITDWPELHGLSLLDQLDIGYLPHEKKFNYRYTNRLKNSVFPLAAYTGKLGEKDYSESGRMIIGSEQFTLKNLHPGRPLHMVLRTGRSVAGKVYFRAFAHPVKHVEMPEKITLNLHVDETSLPPKEVELNETGFSELLFTIPAQYITGQEHEISISGDHISFSYWFYQ
jgi:hypothetical protein